MQDLYPICRFMVQFFGPLLLVCLVLMYVSVYRYTGKAPLPKEVLVLYVRHNLKSKRHAGLLTYLLITGSLFFVLSAIGLVAGYLTK